MDMSQSINIYVINLDKRIDRLERLGGQLDDMGLKWQRISAIDATKATPDAFEHATGLAGPLGKMGMGDRACATSHNKAWRAFLESDATFGLFLEDDVYLSSDTPKLLTDDTWIKPGIDVVKLEKYDKGVSKILLGQGFTLPNGRTLRPMYSRHVGGAAYILSRKAAAAAVQRRNICVPVDHYWFNANVSPMARRFKPHLINPGMATQREFGFNSDMAFIGRSERPQGWRMKWRRAKRGFYEISRLPQQLLAMAFLGARVTPIEWIENFQEKEE